MKKAFAFLLTIIFLLSCTSCMPIEAHEFDNVSDYAELFKIKEMLCNLGCAILFPSSCDEDFNYFVEWITEEQKKETPSFESYPHDDEYWSAITPPLIDNLQVIDFYLHWKLWFVGNSIIEFFLSVQYDETTFESEKERISTIRGNEPIVYDITSFKYPAYVTALGCYGHTSQYALLDEDALVIHYVHLQLMPIEDLKASSDLLPIKYEENGKIKDNNYSIF